MPISPGISKRDLTYTGVTAGTPATIAPSGTRAPFMLKDLKADKIIGDAGTAKPTDAWAADEHVQLRNGNLATWSGTAWVAYIRSVTPGSPGAVVPSDAALPADLTALGAHPVVGDSGTNTAIAEWAGRAWTELEWLVLDDDSLANWDGEQWVEFSTVAYTAVAGSPGEFTPEGETAPANLSALIAHIVCGDEGVLPPTTAWDPAEWVALGDASLAAWDGTGWVEFSTVAYSVTAGAPGSFGPEGVDPPADLDALIAHPVIGDAGCIPETTAWTAGDHVVLGDASLATWDGDGWVVYVAE